MRSRLSAAGLMWMFAVQFFVAQIVVQAAWTTPFSLANNYVSDLGNTACGNYRTGVAAYVCSPWHAVMNASFLLQGVIIIVGTLLVAPFVRGKTAKHIVLSLLILTAVGMIGVGAFPENINNDAHVYSAAIQFVTGNLALIVVGFTRIMPGTELRYSLFSIVLGILGLMATALFPTGNDFGLGTGGMERVAAYTFPMWLIWTGSRLLLSSRK